MRIVTTTANGAFVRAAADQVCVCVCMYVCMYEYIYILALAIGDSFHLSYSVVEPGEMCGCRLTAKVGSGLQPR